MATRTLLEMSFPQDWADPRTKELVQNPKIRKYEDEGHDLRLIRIIDPLYFYIYDTVSTEFSVQFQRFISML